MWRAYNPHHLLSVKVTIVLLSHFPAKVVLFIVTTLGNLPQNTSESLFFYVHYPHPGPFCDLHIRKCLKS